jgi:hypothetical protein
MKNEGEKKPRRSGVGWGWLGFSQCFLTFFAV